MSWFVIRTATRQEDKVITGLREMFREHDLTASAYLPCETRWARLGDKRAKNVPLLPGYLFVGIKAEDLWRVEGVFGVYKVLSRSREDGRQIPAEISGEFVSTLKGLQEAGVFDRTRAARKLTPKVGMKVVLSDGPLATWIGEITKLKGKDRVVVLLRAAGITGPLTKNATVRVSQLEELAA